MSYFLLAEGLDQEQRADLDDRIFRPLEEDRLPSAAERAQQLAAMGMAPTVVSH